MKQRHSVIQCWIVHIVIDFAYIYNMSHDMIETRRIIHWNQIMAMSFLWKRFIHLTHAEMYYNLYCYTNDPWREKFRSWKDSSSKLHPKSHTQTSLKLGYFHTQSIKYSVYFIVTAAQIKCVKIENIQNMSVCWMQNGSKLN